MLHLFMFLLFKETVVTSKYSAAQLVRSTPAG